MRLFGETDGIWKSVAALCAPSAAVIALGCVFLAVDVPRIVAEEKERVFAAAEKTAMELREDASLASFVWERSKGIIDGAAPDGADFPASMTWKDWRPEGGTKRKDMWGWRETAKGRLVWTRGAGRADGDRVYGRDTDIRERNWSFTFWFFGPLFMATLAWITFKGIVFLRGYAKARDDFLAAAAHDLTTPLAAMRFFIGTDDAEAKRLNERMLRLVSNIKDFLRLGGRRPAPEKKTFDLLKAYREAYGLFRAEYRDLFDGGDVQVSDGGLDALEVSADETLTVQIIWNILGNDLKYAAPYGKVSVSFSKRGRFAVAEFRDEGPGMGAKEMRKAFDRYYRAKTVLESGKGGFGIGLCTSKEFAESMGGSLTVSANIPNGCVFALSLPLASSTSCA